MAFYHIKHITRYTYPSPVIDCANQLMLFPVDDERQEVRQHELRITLQPPVEVFTDYFGNRVGLFSLIKPHQELLIESIIEVDVKPCPAPDITVAPETQWEKLAELRDQFPYMDFLLQEHAGCAGEMLQLIETLSPPDCTPCSLAMAMSEFVYRHFAYKKGITNVETVVDEIWRIRAGVCQDFAHVLLVMLRLAGIPARYVSGYICPINHELRGEGATHAWVEALIPFYGWLGLDPTNNCMVSDRHVRLAIGRSFSDCTPVKGTYKGSSEHTLEVAVTIENGNASIPSTEASPVFSYQVHNPGSVADNSYRRFMEMQQQQ